MKHLMMMSLLTLVSERMRFLAERGDSGASVCIYPFGLE